MHGHGFCLLWDPTLVSAHIVADGLIAFAYFLIPMVLLQLARVLKVGTPRRLILVLFSTFIVSCGTTHVLDIIVLWYPVYWLQAAIKLVTAAASVGTFLVLLHAILHSSQLGLNQGIQHE